MIANYYYNLTVSVGGCWSGVLGVCQDCRYRRGLAYSVANGEELPDRARRFLREISEMAAT